MKRPPPHRDILLDANWLEYALIAALIGVSTLSALTLFSPPIEPSFRVPEISRTDFLRD